jgi:hypothetical protein
MTSTPKSQEELALLRELLYEQLHLTTASYMLLRHIVNATAKLGLDPKTLQEMPTASATVPDLDNLVLNPASLTPLENAEIGLFRRWNRQLSTILENAEREGFTPDSHLRRWHYEGKKG